MADLTLRKAPKRSAFSAAAALCLCAALPASANPAETVEPQDESSETNSFANAFESFAAEPAAAEIPPHAVDLATIEAPARRIELTSRGVASYYGKRFHGRLTANGERFDMGELTAAHKTLPFGSRVQVTNPRNGKSVVVRINDRGPYVHGREIDLSRRAAREIGLIQRGHGEVELILLQD